MMKFLSACRTALWSAAAEAHIRVLTERLKLVNWQFKDDLHQASGGTKKALIETAHMMKQFLSYY